MKKVVYYAEFSYPDFLVSESATEKLLSDNVEAAKAETLCEVGSAFGFQIRHRTEETSGDEVLTGPWVDDTKTIYVMGEVRTLAEVKAANAVSHRILIANMECNKWDRAILMPNGQAFPFEAGNELIPSASGTADNGEKPC